jgi:uncharacterized membrane protein
MTPRWLQVAALACVVLGVFFRVYHLDRKVFWEDEMLGTMRMFGYTEADLVREAPHFSRAGDVQAYLRLPADRSKDSLRNTLTALAAEDPQHTPAYYLAGHLWAEAFGSSLAALRSLPALFGILVIPCVFWLGLELFDSRPAALVATALVAVSPVFVLYAQEVREYSLWMMAIALLSVTFLRALRTGTVVSWCIYCASVAAGLYIYPLTILVALGQGAYVLVRDRFRPTRDTARYAAALFVAGAAFLPWIVEMLRDRGLTRGARGLSGIAAAQLGLASRLSAAAHDIRSPFVDFGYLHASTFAGAATNGLFTLSICALVAYAFVVLVRTQAFRVWGFVVLGLCAPFLPLFAYRGFVYQTRYFAPLLLGLILAVAALFARKIASGSRARRAVWASLFVGVLATQIASCYRSSQADTWWNKDGESSRLVAAAVNGARAPIVVSRWFVSSILGLSYYLDADVPVRVALECSNCTLATPRRADLFSGVPDRDDVFVMDPPAEAPAGERFRLIDPRPFPPAGEPLTMFQRWAQ